MRIRGRRKADLGSWGLRVTKLQTHGGEVKERPDPLLQAIIDHPAAAADMISSMWEAQRNASDSFCEALEEKEEDDGNKASEEEEQANFLLNFVSAEKLRAFTNLSRSVLSTATMGAVLANLSTVFVVGHHCPSAEEETPMADEGERREESTDAQKDEGKPEARAVVPIVPGGNMWARGRYFAGEC
jgi:hypothetical protein